MIQVVKTRYEAEVSGYVNNVRKAGLATKDFSKNAASSFAASREEWSKFGGAIMKGSAAVGVGVGIAVKRFADFEQSMSGVKAVSGATASEMALLEKAAIELGASTQFSATEVALAQEELVKAGLSTSEVLDGALAGSLDLAAAGNLELADAATISAQAMNLFNLEGSDVAHVADVLAAGANKSSADVADLAQAMQQTGTVASQTGLSLEETTAALAMFADQGIRGSDAGTSLKTMLQRLTPQSDQAKGKMEELGFSAYDAAGNFIGLEGLSRELQESFGGLDTESRNAALGVVFGSDAIRGASILMEGGAEAAREYTTAVNDQGAAARVAADRMDNLKGDLEELSGAFETLLIQGGSGLGDGLRDIVQTLTGMVEGFTELPSWVQESTVKIAAFTAAAGLLTGGTIKVATTVAGWVESFRDIRKTAPGAATGIANIAKAAAGLGALMILSEVNDAVKDWTRRNDDLNQLADAISNVGSAAELAEVQVAWMTRSGAFGQEDAISGAEALDRLAESAQIAFGDEIWDKLGRLQNSGSMERFTQDAAGLDQVLAQMVRDGNAEAAAEIYDELVKKATAADGVTFDEVNRAFGEYTEAAKGAAGATAEVIANADAWDNATFPDLNPTITDNERLAESTQEVNEALEEATEAWREWMAGFSDASAGFAPLSSVLSEVDAEMQEWAQAQADAFNETIEGTDKAARSWEDYVDDFKLSLDTYKDHLKSLAKDQAEWGDNMQYLAGRVSDEFLQELARLGPEGAPLVAELVDASDKELAEMDDLFLETGYRAPQRMAEGIDAKSSLAEAAGRTLGQKTIGKMLDEVDAGELTIYKAIDKYDLKATIELLADDDPAMAALLQYIEDVETAEIIAKVDADTGLALGKAEDWEKDTAGRKPTPKIDADAALARGVSDSWERDTARMRPTPKIDADDGPGRDEADAFYRYVRGLMPWIDVDAETREAQSAIDGWFGRNSGRTLRVSIAASVGSSTGVSIGLNNADGGFYQYADGGMTAGGQYVPRRSMMGGPMFGRTNIMWGEPETGWEAYISGKPGMRERNIGILEQAAERLGVSVLRGIPRFANGGFLPASMNVGMDTSGMFSSVTSAVGEWAKKLTAFDSGPAGAMQWPAIWRIIKAVIPDAVMTSNYRPGAKTAGYGTTSLHALSRAVDFVTSHMVADTIKLRMLRPWMELIHTPAGPWQRNRNGGSSFNAVTRANHYDHVHVGAADGALLEALRNPKAADTGFTTLKPKWNLRYNGLGRDEHMVDVKRLASMPQYAGAQIDYAKLAETVRANGASLEGMRIEGQLEMRGGDAYIVGALTRRPRETYAAVQAASKSYAGRTVQQ